MNTDAIYSTLTALPRYDLSARGPFVTLVTHVNIEQLGYVVTPIRRVSYWDNAKARARMIEGMKG